MVITGVKQMRNIYQSTQRRKYWSTIKQTFDISFLIDYAFNNLIEINSQTVYDISTWLSIARYYFFLNVISKIHLDANYILIKHPHFTT